MLASRPFRTLTLRAFTGTQSCVLQTTAGDLTYSVDSGPLNRDGESYLLLVHPMP